ncbi:MAG: PfkB family carbohydrate kinase [Planctomycetota bacterium]|nr:PfkB family carbohydrate kinase [Planctomycetota bacterium]
MGDSSMQPPVPQGRRPVIVGLGEALWDVFPDRECFGGAPANFACMAAELGGDRAEVHMVTGVGDDDRGRRALDVLCERRVGTSCVKTTGHPTGCVDVNLDGDGRPIYAIAPDAAWDHVPWLEDVAALAHRTDLVCFGSLAQRASESRKTVRAFVESTPPSAFRILDVNLRLPHDDREVVLESLERANVLKLSDEELPVISAWCGVEGKPVEALAELGRRHDLVAIALTRGARGALLLRGDEVSDCHGVTVDVVDTVGAGDAFTAAFAFGLLSGEDLDAVNRRACEVASYVCTQPGATPALPSV